MSKLLDQYQAALFLSISPELLEYFTSHTVKKDDRRKLQPAKRREDLIYFEVDELKSYDAWLRGPWPSEPKKRPHLPAAIRDEVKSETAGECALCQKHGNSCEAAHISPVSQTKCNHPHNLLWLCTNHHTKFDNGSIGPKGASNELIKATKLVFQSARKHIWQHTADVSLQLAGVLKLCNDLHSELQANPSSTVEVETVSKQLLKLLPALASKSNDESVKSVLEKITASIPKNVNAGISSKESNASHSLEFIGSFEQEFLRKAGLQECPLCAGSRWHNEQECPICQGEGSISLSADPDLSGFSVIPCRLCTGSGQVDDHYCPACRGEGAMETRFDEQINWEIFQKILCKLCKGSGIFLNDDCPVCLREGRIPRYASEMVNIGDFDVIKCPLCDGSKFFDGDDCPACGGEGEMQKRYAELVDLSLYSKEECKLCKGSGLFFNGTCRICDGERYVTRRQNESFDSWDYKMVTCPSCKGAGCDFCDHCGELPRYLANRIADE